MSNFSNAGTKTARARTAQAVADGLHYLPLACNCTGLSSSCVCLPPRCLLASRFEARILLMMLLVARLFCSGHEQTKQQRGGWRQRRSDLCAVQPNPDRCCVPLGCLQPEKHAPSWAALPPAAGQVWLEQQLCPWTSLLRTPAAAACG